jgi:hypothetical protein
METSLRLFGALCALTFSINQVQAAPDSSGTSGVQLTMELRDGSRVVGKNVEDTLSFHSAALGDMKLPWAGIRSIEFAGTNTSLARLTAANGDGFAITLAAETLRVETGFGQTEMPVKLIRSVKVSPPAAARPAASAWQARLTIELRDGSHLVGNALDHKLRFLSPAMGDLYLLWPEIRSIEYAGTNTDMARLTATNGDVYEVQFSAPAVSMETSFGKSELPVKLIRSIKVSAAGNAGQTSSSLVARWTGDGNATDSAGHYDGQISGGVSYVPGPSGQAFQFNGGAAQVDFGDSAGNFGTNNFTIAYWIRTDSKDPWDAFLSKRASCDGGSPFWEIRVGGRGVVPGVLRTVLFNGGNEDAYILDSSHAVNDGRWHHIACVRQSNSSGSFTCLVYVDGVLDNSKPLADAVSLVNQAPLVLGQNVCQCCDGTRPYGGAAADLRLFSQALSAEEILGIYNEEKSGK